jgi:uncharacterized protein YegP (UPF0339 family)
VTSAATESGMARVYGGAVIGSTVSDDAVVGAARTRRDPTMAGKFELWTDKGGDWRFNLKASNGQVIATSQGYNSKASALNGIESVKTNAPGAEVVEIEK